MGKRGFILTDGQILLLEWVLILGFSIFPVFLHFPYRINIFLSWEGAYRLYLGQVPYKDFGLPMGFGYWIIPALFFKIFGPYLITLVKAQAFINIISAFAFRSILIYHKIKPPVRMLSVLLFLISFSFVNFWPWYNHSVIVFEFVGISFLFKYIYSDKGDIRLFYLFLASLFLFISVFTKQDAGALAFMVALALIVVYAIYEKRIQPIAWFLGFYISIAILIVVPFIPYHIGYWFNYGQAPHYSRLSFFDIFNVFLGKSQWIKFYLLTIFLILIFQLKKPKQFLQDKKAVYFSILVIGILFEAAIFQVTSYIPEYNNIFFHSFAIPYVITFSRIYHKVNFRRPIVCCFCAFLIVLWWSPRPWQYSKRLIAKYLPNELYRDTSEVSIRTFMLDEQDRANNTSGMKEWIPAPWRQFKDIDMPKATIRGIQRVLKTPLVEKYGGDIKILNMTELTPLADIIGYVPESGPWIPLWYHKNVAIFESQIETYINKIENNYYDMVLFEYIPILNNFYPFEIREALQKYYKRIDSFPAPRRDGYGSVEVYQRRPKDE